MIDPAALPATRMALTDPVNTADQAAAVEPSVTVPADPFTCHAPAATAPPTRAAARATPAPVPTDRPAANVPGTTSEPTDGAVITSALVWLAQLVADSCGQGLGRAGPTGR